MERHRRYWSIVSRGLLIIALLGLCACAAKPPKHIALLATASKAAANSTSEALQQLDATEAHSRLLVAASSLEEIKLGDATERKADVEAGVADFSNATALLGAMQLYFHELSALATEDHSARIQSISTNLVEIIDNVAVLGSAMAAGAPVGLPAGAKAGIAKVVEAGVSHSVEKLRMKAIRKVVDAGSPAIDEACKGLLAAIDTGAIEEIMHSTYLAAYSQLSSYHIQHGARQPFPVRLAYVTELNKVQKMYEQVGVMTATIQQLIIAVQKANNELQLVIEGEHPDKAIKEAASTLHVATQLNSMALEAMKQYE